MKDQRLVVMISKDMMDDLEALANGRDEKRSVIVREAIAKHLAS